MNHLSMMANSVIATSVSFGVSRVHRGAVLVVWNSDGFRIPDFLERQQT